MTKHQLQSCTACFVSRMVASSGRVVDGSGPMASSGGMVPSCGIGAACLLIHTISSAKRQEQVCLLFGLQSCSETTDLQTGADHVCCTFMSVPALHYVECRLI